MTSSVTHSMPPYATVPSPRDRTSERPAISGRKISEKRRASRDVAASLLENAFPADSENERCRVAAAVLGVSENTVRRILQRETDAKFSVIWPLLLLAAPSAFISQMETNE